jgi:hypothetical protein
VHADLAAPRSPSRAISPPSRRSAARPRAAVNVKAGDGRGSIRGHGRSWEVMGGHGRSWEVMGGHGRSSIALSGPHLVDEGRGECELRLESQEDALHFEQSGPAILGRRNQGSSVAIESQS